MQPVYCRVPPSVTPSRSNINYSEAGKLVAITTHQPESLYLDVHTSVSSRLQLVWRTSVARGNRFMPWMRSNLVRVLSAFFRLSFFRKVEIAISSSKWRESCGNTVQHVALIRLVHLVTVVNLFSSLPRFPFFGKRKKRTKNDLV